MEVSDEEIIKLKFKWFVFGWMVAMGLVIFGLLLIKFGVI